MKVFKITRWIFLVMAILFVGLLCYLIYTSDSNKRIRAVGNISEDIICDILFIAIPFAVGLAALSALIVIKKRCYGSKKLMTGMSVMFLSFAVLIYLVRGVNTDRTIRSLKSNDGQHMLYYVQERSERTGVDWMRVYRRTNAFTYESVFEVDNDKTDLIIWEADGVEYNNKKYEYSSY